uniref:Uncharacterized protein n=1 Tax=Cacopsylla melanoneura TaxID=428564 RepID=A0A8D9ASV4_9HEMI
MDHTARIPVSDQGVYRSSKISFEKRYSQSPPFQSKVLLFFTLSSYLSEGNEFIYALSLRPIEKVACGALKGPLCTILNTADFCPDRGDFLLFIRTPLEFTCRPLL